MERVAQLLHAQEHRQALVRLWVLGSNGWRLNEWERSRGDDNSFGYTVAQFLSDLQCEAALTLERIQAAPLALIRALDECVFATNARYNRAATSGRANLARREEGKDYWLVPVTLRARQLASLSKQVGNLGAWFRRHAVLPAVTAHGLNVKLILSQSAVDHALESLWLEKQPALQVWIGHFNDGADVVWDRSRNTEGDWRTRHIAPHEVRMASLLAAVSSAAEAGAHVVVFPEFTLDVEQRRLLVEHLRRNLYPSLILVVAGSFHESVGDKAFNTAPLYSAAGRTVLTHSKLRLFGTVDGGAEDVCMGDSVHVLLTPIGCMTVLICKDFMDAHPSVESLLTEVPVDWALVPSYGDEKTIKAHKERAKALAVVKTGTTSVVAQTLNTAIPREPPKKCVRGFGHAAGHEEPEPQVGESGDLVSFVLEQQEAAPPASRARPALKRVK